MKVKLSDGKTIELKEPTEKNQIEYLDMYDQASKDKLSNIEIIAWQNNMIKELSSLSDEDLNNMTLVDKSKIKEAIISRYTLVGPCSRQTDF